MTFLRILVWFVIAAAVMGAAVWLAEDVKAIVPRSRFAQPGLMHGVCFFGERPRLSVPDDIPFEVGKRIGDLVESCTRNSDFEIAVGTSEPADEEVQRPPGNDVPAC